MAAKSRKKKLLPVAAVLTAAALGAGIWFSTRDSGEPVNVYPFEYIGMTEFWGDGQESYGPVTTDNIQTAFLSSTQTVTKVAVKKGDTVKQGDILFSFDTTLDALSLEKKRLEVEKVKVQIKAAEERLAQVKKLDPYIPVPNKAPEKEALVDKWEESDMISDNTAFDGKKPESALICWLKEEMPISDAILQALYDAAVDSQHENAQKEENTKVPEETETEKISSASEVPDSENSLNLLHDGQEKSKPSEENVYSINIRFVCDGQKTETITLQMGKDGYTTIAEDGEKIHYPDAKDGYVIPIARDYSQKTYWMVSIVQRIDESQTRNVEKLTIPTYPQDIDGQRNWEESWGKDIEIRYDRKILFEGKFVKDKQLVDFDPEEPVQLKVGQDVVLVISSLIQNLPKEAELKFAISPENDIFEITQDGNDFYLMGKPEKLTATPVEYEVTAEYSFYDNDEEKWFVRESFPFSVSVVPEKQKDSFYAVFKTTKDNYQKGSRTYWQGYKVTAYEDGSFDLLPYDASEFTDHTLPLEENIEIELPVLSPNEMYTEEQILDMQKQLYTTIKTQKEKLKLAETEYAIMQRELGDGNVYAEIDGKVVSLLTEEEARERKQPLVKVSGGGGFYIEGSVSELEKDSLKIGQEVTVNDWNTGNVYTGEVVSIGDFPREKEAWNGLGNPTASYYPFTAFVGEEADLEEGSNVSVTYSAAAAEDGIYLDKAFVRTEKGKSYIYVRGADGKLEERAVRVGKLLWGSYYEILSDLDEGDYLAFPYGKNVKHGAPTVESDISVLYSY